MKRTCMIQNGMRTDFSHGDFSRRLFFAIVTGGSQDGVESVRFGGDKIAFEMKIKQADKNWIRSLDATYIPIGVENQRASRSRHT